MESLPLADGQADAILCMLALHHVAEAAKAMQEMARGLRPGGTLVLLDMVEHGREEFRRNMGHQHLGFREDGVRRAAGPHLSVKQWRLLPKDAGSLGPPLFLAILKRAV